MSQLVLIPGLNNTGAVFAGVCAALPAGITCLTPNCPAETRVEAIAEQLLRSLPERFHLLGFSFGGYVALAMLEQAPERVAGFGLMCSLPFADTPAQAERRSQALKAIAAFDDAAYFAQVESQAANAFHPDSLANTELMAARRVMLRDYGLARYRAHVEAALHRPDRSGLLTNRPDTLVIAASHDKVIDTPSLLAYAATLPGAHITQIEAAGHLAPMERPNAVAQALASWLKP